MATGKNNNENNVIDERHEELINEVNDILAADEQEQERENQRNRQDQIIDDLLIEINEQEEKNREKEEALLIDNENNEEKENEEIKENEINNEERVDENFNILIDNENEDEKENEALANWEKADDEKIEADIRLEENANSTMFMDRLNTFNSMFKTDIDSNKFVDSVVGALELMKNEDKEKQLQGKNMLHDMFRDSLKAAFDVEKESSYKEHRLPDFPEIIRSTNDLMRVAMFTFTDVYAEEKNKELFDATAFGGLGSTEMAKLAAGLTELDEKDSVWDLDQKSDQAWEIQSAGAKDLAWEWLKEEKPYEKMISEMNDLSKNGKNISNNNEIYKKLAAAEWMLMQDEKMMVEDPEDPYNSIPNWGNRYWKAITQAREALNIPKHTSIRELIQNDYATMSKAVYSAHYNERQINELVIDPDARGNFDSMEAQKSEFTIQREAIKNTLENKEPRPEDKDPDVSRYPYPVKEEDEYKKHREAKKENNFIKEKEPQEKMIGIDK